MEGADFSSSRKSWHTYSIQVAHQRGVLGGLPGELLFGLAATGFDASTCRNEKCTRRAYNGKNSCWIFRGFSASALRIEREGDG
jgi:hypothetical protein